MIWMKSCTFDYHPVVAQFGVQITGTGASDHCQAGSEVHDLSINMSSSPRFCRPSPSHWQSPRPPVLSERVRTGHGFVFRLGGFRVFQFSSVFSVLCFEDGWGGYQGV